MSALPNYEEELESYSDVDVASVDVDVRDARRLLRVDCEFFIEFFLAEQLDMPVPEFHKEIWTLLTEQDKDRVLLAIPRDHAKTTLAKLVVIWYWLYTSHRFCVYLSNTSPIAKGACKDIIGFVKSDAFASVFGAPRFTKESDNEGLWEFDLELIPGKIKHCILRSIGQGQQMRGINIDNQRPDIAVVDDVEDNENTDTETQQKKLDRWVFGPFIKALARKKKLIWLGNMLTKTSLLARLSRNPRWNPVVFGALVKDTSTGQLVPLWPGKWSIEQLQEDFKEYRDLSLVESWMCEMMNMPGHGANGFMSEQLYLVPQPLPEELRAAWITVDPAFGLKADNDESSISVHGIRKVDALPVTVAIIHGRWDETRLFREILGQAMYWNAWVWGIEAIAAQRVLIPLFNMLLAGERLNHHVEQLPLISGRGDPKMGRIRAFVSLMAKREWGMYETAMSFINQLLGLDTTKKEQADDIVDSAAYGPLMMEQYLPIIMAQASGADLDSTPTTQSGRRVTGNV